MLRRKELQAMQRMQRLQRLHKFNGSQKRKNLKIDNNATNAKKARTQKRKKLSTNR